MDRNITLNIRWLLVAGLLAPLIVARGMSFAVHGTAELAFTGGAAALLTGIGVQVGAVVGAVVGFVGGIYLVELGHSRDRGSAWTSTRAALKAVFLSIGIELLAGLAIATTWVLGVLVTT